MTRTTQMKLRNRLTRIEINTNQLVVYRHDRKIVCRIRRPDRPVIPQAESMKAAPFSPEKLWRTALRKRRPVV